MKCENCGGHTRQGDTYCPNCGMELLRSEYKPLQKRYMRGEYQEVEDNFYEERQDYYSETAEYSEGYDHEYEETRKSGGMMLPIILILIIALLIGLVMGFIMFTSNLQPLTSP